MMDNDCVLGNMGFSFRRCAPLGGADGDSRHKYSPSQPSPVLLLPLASALFASPSLQGPLLPIPILFYFRIVLHVSLPAYLTLTHAHVCLLSLIQLPRSLLVPSVCPVSYIYQPLLLFRSSFLSRFLFSVFLLLSARPVQSVTTACLPSIASASVCSCNLPSFLVSRSRVSLLVVGTPLIRPFVCSYT